MNVRPALAQRPQHLYASEGGFTLIEILVTVVILAVGLLGMAGLQLTGMRNNQSTYLRTQAALLANDMGERMRANATGFQNGSYDVIDEANGKNVGEENVDCRTIAGCTDEQMARNDIYEWNKNLSGLLPMGTGVVCIDSTPNDGSPDAPGCDSVGDVYVFKLWWDDARSGNVNQFFAMSFE